MRTKALLTSILLATTAVAGVASADPIVRDHRYQQPAVSYRAPIRWQNGVRVQTRPSWMVNASANVNWGSNVGYRSDVDYGAGADYGTNVNYGYQIDANGDEAQAYRYGQDPYVEGIARGEWGALAGNLRLAYNQQSEVNVNVGGQRLQSIELQATGGRNWISEVHVLLNDGREIKLPTSRFVDVVHSPNMRLDLGAEAQSGVRRIEIFGYSSGKGTFSVLGA